MDDTRRFEDMSDEQLEAIMRGYGLRTQPRDVMLARLNSIRQKIDDSDDAAHGNAEESLELKFAKWVRRHPHLHERIVCSQVSVEGAEEVFSFTILAAADKNGRRRGTPPRRRECSKVLAQ